MLGALTLAVMVLLTLPAIDTRAVEAARVQAHRAAAQTPEMGG